MHEIYSYIYMSQMQIQLWKIVLHPPGFKPGSLVYETSALPNGLKGFPQAESVSSNWLVKTPVHIPLHEESHPHVWRYSGTFASLTRNIIATHRNTESTLEWHLQIQIQLWKIVLHPPGFEIGSFGLWDQYSTEWVKGDSLQPSQYQATGSYRHLWHIKLFSLVLVGILLIFMIF